MKPLAIVLCICIVQGGEGSFMGSGFDGILDSIGKLKPRKPMLLENTLKWARGGAELVGMSVGDYLIRPPLLRSDSLLKHKDLAREMGVDLLEAAVKGAGEGLKQGWESVVSFRLPGLKYMMMFPNAVVSILDKTKGTLWYLATKTGRKLVASEAYMIYAALQTVSRTIAPAMRLIHLDCITMRRMKQKIDSFIVDELEVANCKVCGLSNLEAVNNVTVTSEGKSFMIVEVPYLIRNISVKITAANVTDYSGYLLENTPMTVTIKKTRLKGSVYFTRGTLLKFITIKLRVIGFDDFNIKIDVPRENRTPIMDIVEGISDILASYVRKSINRKFEKFEKKLSNAITGSPVAPKRYSTRKCLAVLLCVCILQHQTGGKFLPGLGSVREFIGKVASAVPSFITKGMPLGMGDAKSIGMAIGKNVIRPPLLGAERLINAKDSLLEMGAELMKSVVKGARLVLKKEWEAVQTIKLPGWKYIMVFPNAVISVVDKATDTAWFLVSETGRKVVAAEAFMIYASMKVISETVGPAMRLLYLDCIRMQRMKQKIGTFMVDELEFAECKVCGLPNLEAVNNVTVTSEGKSFMIVEVPYLARNISVKITAANVTDYSGYLLENTPMAVTIKKTRLKGSVYFTRGTLLKFFTVKLRVIGFDDFNIKIDVPRENRTPIMDIVEGISDVLANMVKNAINRSLQRFEKQLSKIITQEAPSNTPPSD